MQDNLATLELMLQPIHNRIDAANGETIENGVTGKMDKLDLTKETIRQVITSKGISVGNEEPFSVYPEKINQLPAFQADDWIPNPTWWDIETILREDAEDYPYKAIYLLNDSRPTGTMTAGFAYKTSDGKFYDGTTTAIHTWDPAADKPCDEGYGTRYVIIYGDAGHPVYNSTVSRSQLYILVSGGWKLVGSHTFSSCLQSLKGLDGEPITMVPNDLRPNADIQTWAGCNSLRQLRATVGSFVSAQRMFAYCCSLRSMDVALNNAISLNRAWQYCSSLHSLTAGTANATDFSEAWRGCYALEILKADMTKATNATNALIDSRSLIELDLTSIPVNLDLSVCENLSIASVNRIINQLRDYSAGSTRTLNLHANIQVTAELKAVATKKNWIIA